MAGLYLGLTDGRVFHSRDGDDRWYLLGEEPAAVVAVTAARIAG